MLLKNYINGQWVASSSTQSTSVINPATKEKLAETPQGNEKDVDQAVNAAKEAFLGWKKTPAVDRIQYLFKLKTLMEEDFEQISQIITKEHGKTLVESRGSVRRAIQMVETATSIPTLMQGEFFEDIARGIDCSAAWRPMGVFAGIAPFNFPVMVPFWFWPFAVACGNTYVLKASERVPLTAIKVFELLEKAKFPKGVMNLVHGGKAVVDAICTHKDIQGISFVGSTPVAKHIYQLGCSTGKRVQALGGAKNIMVMMPDAMEDKMRCKSVATAVESIIGCAGERCLAGSVILCIGDTTYNKMIEDSVDLAKKVTIGNGLDPKVQMGPVISQESKTRISNLIQKAKDDGAKILFDGRENVDHLDGYFLRPSVISGITPSMQIAQEEVFGPVVLLAKVANLDEAISWINSISFANTSTIFTASGAAARKFCTEVSPNMLGVNIGVPAPMSFFSFGGSKDSFFGDLKAHGKQSVPFFCDTHTTIYRWYSDESIW